MFAPEEISRYGKHLILDDFGPGRQQALKKARVLVIGAGGLGCPVLLYLNAAGVGHIGIADFDVIDISNLHRQVLYAQGDTGRKKITTAIEKLGALNPFTTYTAYDTKIKEDNIAELVREFDLIVDGCDNFETRYTVNDGCVAEGKPLVYGSVLGYEGQIALFNDRGSGNLRDVFPEPPAREDVPDCSENGVLSTVTGIIGTLMAQEAVNALTGRPSLRNKLLLFNAQTFERTLLHYAPLT